MLSYYGVEIKELPMPANLKEEYYAKRKGKKGCPGCGSTKNIIKGFGRLVWERITKGQPEQFIIERAEICNECEHRTFLNVREWFIEASTSWVLNKLKNEPIDDLPINHNPEDWDALWCSVCRCFLEAKLRAPKEQCPKNKWQSLENKI